MRLFLNKVREKWSSFKNKFFTFFKTETYTEIKDNIGFIIVYSIIVFLSMIFLLNLLRGNVLSSSTFILVLNFFGAGCSYYLLVDFLKFLKENFKREK